MKYFNKSNLKEIINFGKMPMANNFLKDTKKRITPRVANIYLAK